jgi:LysM repeat protein
MSQYTIRRGDCLSVLAQRFNTSVSALMKANPQIKNANLIYTGAKLSIPGKSDGFESGRGGSSTSGAHPSHPSSSGGTRAGGSSGPGDAPTTGGNSSAYNVAADHMGRNISDLKYNGDLAKYLDKWPGNNVCCANFVSACLEKSGQISPGQHSDSVSGLASNLRNDKNFSETSLKNAKPGDVVCFNVPGEGPYSHVEMFAGWKNGQPQFIGSNNVNSDGSQRISQGYAGYPIAAIFHYNG